VTEDKIKQGIPKEPLSSGDFDGQKPQGAQSACYLVLNAHYVQIETEKLIQEAQPSLNGEALHQEGIRLYRQMEAHIPYNHYQRVYISSELIRSLVLHSLREAGISLGVQNSSDKLISGLLKGLQNSDKKPQKVRPSRLLLAPLKLLKNGASPVCVLFRGMRGRLKAQTTLKRLKRNNPS